MHLCIDGWVVDNGKGGGRCQGRGWRSAMKEAALSEEEAVHTYHGAESLGGMVCRRRKKAFALSLMDWIDQCCQYLCTYRHAGPPACEYSN